MLSLLDAINKHEVFIKKLLRRHYPYKIHEMERFSESFPMPDYDFQELCNIS